MSPITVALVEDDPAALRSLVRVLEGSPGFRCVGAYSAAESALRRIPQERPQVALVDLRLPRMQGCRLIWELKQRSPGTELLVHTVNCQPREVFRALQAGASGYLVKGASSSEIRGAIETVQQGGAAMSPLIARLVVQRLQRRAPTLPDLPHLTQRESEVLALFVEGRTKAEIGEELGISENTVRTYVRRIFEVLQAHSRAEVIAWWHEYGDSGG